MRKTRLRPTRDFDAFFLHLKEKQFSPSACIDVGAAKGTNSIYKAFPDAYHIVFEPLPDFHKQLTETMAPYRHEIHHCALMEQTGEMDLLRHPDRFGSSLMHSRKSSADDLVSVPVDTLDNVLRNKDLSDGLLIKTDCQGADLFVLQGGLHTLGQADVVIIEASLFRFWGPHHPDLFEIMQFMQARGFSLYDALDGLYRPYDNALGQLDLAFVKEAGPFRKTHQW